MGSRFALAEDNLTIGATLINGNAAYGASRPPLSESAQYPMSRLLENDRFTVWQAAPSLTGEFLVQFDLGANKSIDVICVHGFRRADGTALPSSVQVLYQTDADGYAAYPTDWTLVATLQLTGRDAGLQLSVPRNGRYWCFRFGGTEGGFTIGNFYLGNLSYETADLYSPGATDELIRSRVRVRSMSGVTVFRDFGYNRRRFTIPFQSALKPDVDILRAVALSSGPITHITPWDEVFQVELADDKHDVVHDWRAGDDDLMSSVLIVESLP